MFESMYDKILLWAQHRFAVRFLAIFSFIESIFFPIPTDVMLIPIVLRAPTRAFYLAAVTTVASVAGGLVGYLLGAYGFEMLEPVLHQIGYWDRYQRVIEWFDTWGFWVVFIAGFSPLPYKLFTVGAGALNLAFLPFVIASLIGRGARFYLVAKVVAVFGPKVEPTVRKYIEWLGWGCVILLLALIAYSSLD
ncbi:MAG: YqaA family protein [Pseudomonadota bacterium]